MANKFLVYVLSDPRTGEIRYVGKTGRSLEVRLKEHLQDARRSRRYCSNWIKSLGNLEPLIELVEEYVSEELVNDAESFWIVQFRALGFKLTNLTDGGDGTLGCTWKLTPKQCLAISKRERTAEWRANLGAAHRGKVVSPETRAKLSAATKGRPKGPFSEEHKRKIGDAQRGIKKGPRTQEYKNSLSARSKKPVVDQFGTIYESGRDAAKILGLLECCISDVLNGRQKTTGGYIFKRVN